MVGKLTALQEDTFSLPAGSTSSFLVYLQDQLSSRHFLVDSDASISVVPSPVLCLRFLLIFFRFQDYSSTFCSLIFGSTVFSKLDLQKGYYQVPVALEEMQKPAIITHFGM